MMKRREYVKPTMLVVKLQNRLQLLAGSYDVIPPGQPNLPPA